MLMGIPEECDKNVEYCRTHQELLPDNQKENLYTNRVSKKPKTFSRSVLSEVGNPKNIPGVLKQLDTAENSRSRVSWSGMVRGNL